VSQQERGAFAGINARETACAQFANRPNELRRESGTAGREEGGERQYAETSRVGLKPVTEAAPVSSRPDAREIPRRVQVILPPQAREQSRPETSSISEGCVWSKATRREVVAIADFGMMDPQRCPAHGGRAPHDEG